MGRKAVCPVCCVTYLKEPSALIKMRRGSPQCSWFDWQHIAQQHLVNICERSRPHDSNCALFSEVRILGDAAFTRKPIDHQNGERGTVAACDKQARYAVRKIAR